MHDRTIQLMMLMSLLHGKLYHPNSPKNEDNPLSWSITYPQDVGGGCSCTPMQNYCRLPENTTCYDVVLTDTVINELHEHHNNKSISSKPFFMGLGVHKPVSLCHLGAMTHLRMLRFVATADFADAVLISSYLTRTCASAASSVGGPRIVF